MTSESTTLCRHNQQGGRGAVELWLKAFLLVCFKNNRRVPDEGIAAVFSPIKWGQQPNWYRPYSWWDISTLLLLEFWPYSWWGIPYSWWGIFTSILALILPPTRLGWQSLFSNAVRVTITWILTLFLMGKDFKIEKKTVENGKIFAEIAVNERKLAFEAWFRLQLYFPQINPTPG